MTENNPLLAAPANIPEPGVRRFGKFNWVGLKTASVKEIQLFLKVGWQTIAAPAIMSFLFLIVFVFAIGRDRAAVGDIPYTSFLAPGLIMMTILQNAFANTSSSIMIPKSRTEYPTGPARVRTPR